jgi:hypothetical protein
MAWDDAIQMNLSKLNGSEWKVVNNCGSTIRFKFIFEL